MIDRVSGKIIWTLPVKGQVLINGHLEALDEILAYWYPTHLSFLKWLIAPIELKILRLERYL